jgi:molecular chaperone IbpA
MNYNSTFFGDKMFGDLDKYFVGADKMVAALTNAHNTITKNIPNYPPYNLKKTSDNTYVLELAVAGFGKQDIELTLEDGTLSIKGTSSYNKDDNNAFTFLHKGIADRAFMRTFNLADTIEIKNAELVNGMLKVWFENIIPEHMKPKRIEIAEPTPATVTPAVAAPAVKVDVPQKEAQLLVE